MNRTNDQKSATSSGRVDLIRSSILASPPWPFAFAHLGGVDGFDPDKGERERDEGAIVLCRLLAPECNALEAFELADRLLDASAAPVEGAREELWPVASIALEGNDRADAAGARSLTIGCAIVALVAHGRTRGDVRAKIEQNLKLRAVARLALCQVEGERQSVMIDLEVNLGRESASGATKRLSVLPPFAPAAETCARTVVESNIWTR